MPRLNIIMSLTRARYAATCAAPDYRRSPRERRDIDAAVTTRRGDTATLRKHAARRLPRDNMTHYRDCHAPHACRTATRHMLPTLSYAPSMPITTRQH